VTDEIRVVPVAAEPVPDSMVILHADIRDVRRGDYVRMAAGEPGGALRWQRIEGVEVRFDSQVKLEFHRPGDDKLGAVVYDVPQGARRPLEIARAGNESQPRWRTKLRGLFRRG
jgi:hypothetical protein